jgi:predicted RNase H-like HicB family nuclease
MLELPYSLIIEATEDPSFFGFFSPTLEGFTGVGNSVEDCLYKARAGMREHVGLLREQGIEVPPGDANPTALIRDEKVLAGP